jgi:hypothetical protein
VQEDAAQLEARMAEELKRSALFQEDLKVVVWLWVVMSNQNTNAHSKTLRTEKFSNS